MTIVCTVDSLVGEAAYADRETDVAFEKDVVVYGEYLGLMIYPKDCWKVINELSIVS